MKPLQFKKGNFVRICEGAPHSLPIGSLAQIVKVVKVVKVDEGADNEECCVYKAYVLIKKKCFWFAEEELEPA